MGVRGRGADRYRQKQGPSLSLHRVVHRRTGRPLFLGREGVRPPSPSRSLVHPPSSPRTGTTRGGRSWWRSPEDVKTHRRPRRGGRRTDTVVRELPERSFESRVTGPIGTGGTEAFLLGVLIRDSGPTGHDLHPRPLYTPIVRTLRPDLTR